MALLFPRPVTRPGGIDGFGIGSPHIRVGIQELDDALDAQQAMGVRWVREEIPWELIEPEKGTWRWSYDFTPTVRHDYDQLLDRLEQRGIEMVALLDYGPRYLKGDPSNGYHVDSDELVALWRGYVRRVVDEFGDRIDYWEIGNEMNSWGFWGKVVIERDDPENPDAPAEPDPVLYARMLRVAHEEIKDHDQDDVIILGGLAGYHSDLANCATNYFWYLGELYRVGAWDTFDVIAFHPYRVGPGDTGHPPETFIERGLWYDPASSGCSGETARYNLISEVRAVRGLVEGYGSKPIWITEIGWSQHWLEGSGYRNIDADLVEADYLVRTCVPLLAEPGVEKVFWYTQCDDPNVGRFRLDPAGQQALGIIASLLTGSKPLGQFQGQDDQGGADDDDVYEYRFERDDQLIIVIWKARGGDEPRDVTVKDLEVETVRAYDIDATDLSVGAGRELTVQDGEITLSLTERPVFLVAEQLNAWDRFWKGIFSGIEEWWETQRAKVEEKIKNWWEEQKAKVEQQIEEWLAELERKIGEELEARLEELLGQLCGSAMLPGGVTVAWWTWRRKRPRN